MNDHSQKTRHGRWINETGTKGLVSVITATYNRAQWLAETVQSVYAQTYRPIELLIVDDGSTDATPELVEGWQRKCAKDNSFNLRYLPQKNQGAPLARNLGLIESHGEFIQFLDSDDLLAPSKIAAQVQHLSACENKSVMYGQWRFFKNLQDYIEIYDVHSKGDEENALGNWLGGWFVPPHSLLWQRKDVAQIGPWDESLAADQDGDFAMRFLLDGGKLVFCPSAWVYYRFHETPDSSIGAGSSSKAFESRYRVTRRIEENLTAEGVLEKYRSVLSLRYARLANRYATADKQLAKQCLEKSRKLSPDGRLPDIFSYPLLSKLLGLTLKQRIGHWLHKTFAITIGNARTEHAVPVSTVQNTVELCSFDERQTENHVISDSKLS
jgi:glycosyltransferase involved in cell wall biosynthesis